MDQVTDVKALADRFFDAVVAGDIDAVQRMYAPDAVIWHAHTNSTQSLEENLRTLGLVAKYIKDFRYEERHLQATEHGFVEQHVTCGTTPAGDQFSIPSCIVCRVVDGRVTQLDEYFDSAAAAPLLGR